MWCNQRNSGDFIISIYKPLSLCLYSITVYVRISFPQVINTSKEIMCYSDFPIPAKYPIFMHNKYVLQYFHLYAEQFGLRKYIKFQHEVYFSFSNGKLFLKSWYVRKIHLLSNFLSNTIKSKYSILICNNLLAVICLIGIGRITRIHQYKLRIKVIGQKTLNCFS